jgi:hypothetical protein
MRSVALSVAAAAILLTTPALASARQTDGGGSPTSSAANAGKTGGLGLTNSSLFGVGIALAATLGIVLATTTGKTPPPVSP